MELPVHIKRLGPDVPLPEYRTPGAVGFDIAVRESSTLQPGERKILPTGLVVCVPKGHVLLIANRSSNAKKGVILTNGVGIIDPDYCGPEDELHLALYNIGESSYTVEKGERIAQGILVPIGRAEFLETDTLSSPSRGGFGTTG